MKQSIILFFVAIFIASSANAQNDTLAMWSFPNNDLADTLPDLANELNENMYIQTIGGVGDIQMKNSDSSYAAQATKWHDGVGTKAWMIELNTSFHENIELSSKQTSGTNEAGPRDYFIQYKIGENGTWTNIMDDTIKLANDWTTGVVNAALLPEECNNQSSVFVRWVLASAINISGDSITSGGKTKIDDIVFAGSVISDVEQIESNALNIFPNPCSDILNISKSSILGYIRIFDISGSLIYSEYSYSNNLIINTSEFKKGLYLISIGDKKHKLIVK